MLDLLLAACQPKSRSIALLPLVIGLLLTGFATPGHGAEPSTEPSIVGRPDIPDSLKPWKDWATWNEDAQASPTLFTDATVRLKFWPSSLSLSTDAKGGSWQIDMQVFSPCWMPLPGSEATWPTRVRLNAEPVVVVERNQVPSIRLEPGQYELQGEFDWSEMPQKINIPPEVGLLDLTVNETKIAHPNWDAAGNVWLQRLRTEAEEEDLLAAQVYRVIEDGIPLWLKTKVELTVSGQSREEEIGWVLPAGWQLATVDSPIPVAVDPSGKMKAQVRSGKWTINVNAYSTTDLREFQYAADAPSITDVELVGFAANPEFRLAEVTGLPTVDVTQTTYPEEWRHVTVFQWNTSQPFRLNEKTRGMGLQRPEGLTIKRKIWLDESGTSATYRDTISGTMQQIWRLDTVPSQRLGAVRVDGKGQLVTANPKTLAHGVEVRNRNLTLDAIGELDSVRSISATGWQADTDSASITMNLPPGWRMLALFGADEVHGDWLTAWTLLDIFLLLVFALSVSRIWGFPAGIIAFLAFGLTYHEPAAPRLTWFFLLIPLALLQVIPTSAMAIRKCLIAWKWIAAGILAICLIPFLARQIQTAIYPQLESPGVKYSPRMMFGYNRRGNIRHQYHDSALNSAAQADVGGEGGYGSITRSASSRVSSWSKKKSTLNLKFDPKTLIQTGPAQPEWSWNPVHCSWSGPVSGEQTIRPVLLSRNQHRLLSVVRMLLLVLLVAVLSGVRRLPRFLMRQSVAQAAALAIGAFVFLGLPSPTLADEIPDAQTLATLRSRLLETPDAFPNAAEIPSVTLTVAGQDVTMDAEIHAAAHVAVPLPGRLPTWTPISVQIDDEPAEFLRRKDGYLWVALQPGVHQVKLKSQLPKATDWEWTFLLKPRRVVVKAPDWSVSGIDRNGVPEKQVFFSRQQQADDEDSAYDRRDFQVVLAVDRHIETGIEWQVNSTIRRLSGTKAVAVQIPLLPGESVLTGGTNVKNGFLEVRLGSGQTEFSWKSQLPIGIELPLKAAETAEWVEHWHLVTSPVWNVKHTGLAPVFDTAEQRLIPVWHPWPGEEVTLVFTKPKSIAGETTTIHRVNQSTSLGNRQRTHRLEFNLESSLGGDFPVELDKTAQITSVRVEGQAIPVRVEAEKLIVPVRPGKQNVEVNWRSNELLKLRTSAAQVKLPAAAANVTTTIDVPANRWVIWTAGPIRGPAVQFWVLLAFALLVGFILGGIELSPLSRFEWMLLAIGLTQVHPMVALFVVAWLFALAQRGEVDSDVEYGLAFNARQLLLVGMTGVSMCILVFIVGEGLLGHPEMFIVGNGSSRLHLAWFQSKIDGVLPATQIITVSVWCYRLLMLLWALWLASSVIRWLTLGWQNFTLGKIWHSPEPATKAPPVVAEVADGDQQ